MDTIICPHCKKRVELSEAIIHQLSKAQVDKARAEERERTEREQRDKALRESKEKDKELEEMRRKLAKNDEESKKREEGIKEDAKKEAEKDSINEIGILKKQLEDARDAERKATRANQDLTRKLNQTSQQLQGEVGEEWLKNELRKNFPYDDIQDVPKGITGADIIHEVKNKFGNSAGTIIWETKKEKGWNKAWLPKLKDDMRKVTGSDCILVTDVLPHGVRSYDRIENVWVTNYETAVQLAVVIRKGFLDVAIAKSTANYSDENLRNFYKLVTSDSFRHLFEARKEIIDRMSEDLEGEIAWNERRWKKRKEEIDKLKRNNREIYGILESHIPSLKPLKEAEVFELESGEGETTD
ncbi:MAG: hypothetical protein UU21_C0016G0006 [Candidatus Levybacteria bacterium GW2011_GWA2_40_8]|nr:MAG: hypothetical protein UU21_C0016G0006 [Candidatus Levybacteria bacterium GW2011_GWA2_40_8]